MQAGDIAPEKSLIQVKFPLWDPRSLVLVEMEIASCPRRLLISNKSMTATA
jgi:hypothetical protein